MKTAALWLGWAALVAALSMYNRDLAVMAFLAPVVVAVGRL